MGRLLEKDLERPPERKRREAQSHQPLVMRILNRRAMQNGLNVSVRNFAAAVGYDSDRVDQT